jgi:hypothetical protein
MGQENKSNKISPSSKLSERHETAHRVLRRPGLNPRKVLYLAGDLAAAQGTGATMPSRGRYHNTLPPCHSIPPRPPEDATIGHHPPYIEACRPSHGAGVITPVKTKVE